jgi:hypothetical protein
LSLIAEFVSSDPQIHREGQRENGGATLTTAESKPAPDEARSALTFG